MPIHVLILIFSSLSWNDDGRHCFWKLVSLTELDQEEDYKSTKLLTWERLQETGIYFDNLFLLFKQQVTKNQLKEIFVYVEVKKKEFLVCVLDNLNSFEAPRWITSRQLSHSLKHSLYFVSHIMIIETKTLKLNKETLCAMFFLICVYFCCFIGCYWLAWLSSILCAQQIISSTFHI